MVFTESNNIELRKQLLHYYNSTNNINQFMNIFDTLFINENNGGKDDSLVSKDRGPPALIDRMI